MALYRNYGHNPEIILFRHVVYRYFERHDFDRIMLLMDDVLEILISEGMEMMVWKLKRRERSSYLPWMHAELMQI